MSRLATKPTRWHVRPVKTQISPSLIRFFTVRMKKAWVLSYPLSAQRRLWLDLANAQADLSLRWAHSHLVGFVMRRLILFVLCFYLCRFYMSLSIYTCIINGISYNHIYVMTHHSFQDWTVWSHQLDSKLSGTRRGDNSWWHHKSRFHDATDGNFQRCKRHQSRK